MIPYLSNGFLFWEVESPCKGDTEKSNFLLRQTKTCRPDLCHNRASLGYQ